MTKIAYTENFNSIPRTREDKIKSLRKIYSGNGPPCDASLRKCLTWRNVPPPNRSIRIRITSKISHEKELPPRRNSPKRCFGSTHYLKWPNCEVVKFEMTHFQTDRFRHFYDHEKIQELVITESINLVLNIFNLRSLWSKKLALL